MVVFFMRSWCPARHEDSCKNWIYYFGNNMWLCCHSRAGGNPVAIAAGSNPRFPLINIYHSRVVMAIFRVWALR